MGPTTQRRRLERWLQAERLGRHDLAERELAALFAALPSPGLSPAFADGVLAAVRGTRRAALWSLERLAAALFVFTGLALWWTPVWLEQLLPWIQPSSWPSRAFELGERLVAFAFWVGAGVSQLGSFLRIVLLSPQILGWVVLCLLLAALSGRLLYGLLDERSQNHVRIQ